jgi:hemolysin type calcium-binding protein
MSGTDRRSTTVAALAAGLLVALAPATAHAATTIGQSPPSVGTPVTCNSGAKFDDIFQLGTATGNSYTVPPGGGVITSWRTSLTAGSLQEKLRVFTGNAGAVTPVAESALESVSSGGTPTFLTRIPVAGGEFLGLSAMGSSTGCANSGAAAGDVIGVASPSGPVGQSEAVLATGGNALVNVAANLEPDADKDLFGDETQDLSPSDAATQAATACPSKPPTILGTIASETVKGTKKNDVIHALGGDDVVKGRGGNDVVCSGAGNDTLEGGDGKDKLFGESGRDKMNGGGQKDTCNGESGKDKNSACEKGPDS